MNMFGARMRAARERLGLSQVELGQRLGMVRQQINNYEQGRFEPSWDTARRIADALDVSLDYLADRQGDRAARTG